MAIELVDCKFKIHPVTLAILKGKAKAEDKHVADILRTLADGEAEKFRVALIEAQRVLAAHGLLGELQGLLGSVGAFSTPARYAERGDGTELLDLDVLEE